MPKEFDKILKGVKGRLSGKINPRTEKKYSEPEMYAIANSQYKKSKKNFVVTAPISKAWEEEVTINKGVAKTQKSVQRFIEVAVSGLKEDRDGEMMSQEAIDDMVMQFKSGTIPFFPDHGRDEKTGQPNVYSWKQMMGVWSDARQDDQTLKAVVRLNKAHPDAEQFWQYVQEGMSMGFSIGGRPTSAPEEKEIEMSDTPELKKAEGEKIEDVVGDDIINEFTEETDEAKS